MRAKDLVATRVSFVCDTISLSLIRISLRRRFQLRTKLPARFQSNMTNRSALRPDCSALPGNFSCVGPPAQAMPPKDVMSLLTLQETLDPIFTAMEFSTLSIALIGNLLIVLTIFSNKKMRSMAHLFLLNVAIADLSFSALNIAGHATEHLLHEQALKETFCTLYRPLIAVRFVAYAVSMFCLAALSVERWYVVCLPLKAQFSNAILVKKLKFSSLFLIWIIALALSAPMGLCKITVTKTFAVFLALVLHIAPLAVIIVVNIKMILSLKRNAVCEISAVNEGSRERIRKLLITLILSVVIFWSPYHSLFLYSVFAAGPPSSPTLAIKLTIALRVGNAVAYFNPLLNALLYYIFSKEFRKGLSSLLGRCFGHQPRMPKERNGRSTQELSRYISKREEVHFNSTALAETSS